MVTLTWYAYTMHSGVCGGGVKLKTLTAIGRPGDDAHLTSSTTIESKVYVREIESSSENVQHIHAQPCVPRVSLVPVTYYERFPLPLKK